MGSAAKAGKFTLVYAAIGTILYYAHERVWSSVRKNGWLKI